MEDAGNAGLRGKFVSLNEYNRKQTNKQKNRKTQNQSFKFLPQETGKKRIANQIWRNQNKVNKELKQINLDRHFSKEDK